MGNTKAIFATGTTVFSAAVTIIACGSDHQAKPDAPGMVVIDAAVDSPSSIDAPGSASGVDLSCIGNSAPTPNSTVTITGSVNELGLSSTFMFTFGSAANATLKLCTGNCLGTNALGSATSNGSGDFSIGPVTTGGTAIAGYVRMTRTGDRTILGYPASPFAMDAVQPMITFQDTLIALVASSGSAHGCPQAAGNGMVGLMVVDCSGKPISDATKLTVAVQQGSNTVGDAPISASALSSMAAGFYLICDVPPGNTTVSAKYNNMDLLGHDVNVTAGTTTETIIRPGY
jgi:hypothetical protein